MLVQLPNGNDDLPADVCVLHYNGTRGLKRALDTVLSILFGVSCLRVPKPLHAVPKRQSSKISRSEGVTSRPDIHFIPFAVTEFSALGGHATAFLIDVANHTAASKGMHVGKFLAS
jgi:hypothetical protein